MQKNIIAIISFVFFFSTETFKLSGIENIEDIKLKTTDGITDVFVHYKEGKYWVYMEDASGRFQKGLQGLDEAGLADYIRSQLKNKDPIRLNSCSDLKSAEVLAKELDVPVIATKGKVEVYADGGIKSTTDEWFEISPTGKHTPAAKPKEPADGVKGKVRMGTGDYIEASTLEEIAKAIEYSDLRGATIITTKGDFYIPDDWERISLRDGIRYQRDESFGIRLRSLDDRTGLSTSGKPYCRVEHKTNPQYKYDLDGNRVTTENFDDTHFVIKNIWYFDND